MGYQQSHKLDGGAGVIFLISWYSVRVKRIAKIMNGEEEGYQQSHKLDGGA